MGYYNDEFTWEERRSIEANRYRFEMDKQEGYYPSDRTIEDEYREMKRSGWDGGFANWLD